MIVLGYYYLFLYIKRERYLFMTFILYCKISREFFIRGVTPLAFLALLHTDYQ